MGFALFERSVEGESEPAIVRRVADVFACLASSYRPEVIHLGLDSFVVDLFGTPETPLRLDPNVAFFVAGTAEGDTTYGRHGYNAPVYEADVLTPDVIASLGVEAIARARNEGAGRTGLDRVEARVGAALLPPEYAGCHHVELCEGRLRSCLAAVRDGWIAGPPHGRDFPAPLTVLVLRDGWQLRLCVEIQMDVFWPRSGPLPALREALDALVAAGWVETRRG